MTFDDKHDYPLVILQELQAQDKIIDDHFINIVTL